MPAPKKTQPSQGVEVTSGSPTPAMSPERPPALSGDALLDVIARAARDPAVDVDKFERLLGLKREVARDVAEREFNAAFAELGPDLPIIDRKGTIIVYSKRDRELPGGPPLGARPIQKTPYATFEDILEAVRPVLYAHGFAIRFEYETTAEGKLITTAILSHRGGYNAKASSPPLMHDTTGSKNATQAIGSSLSYGMRYALRAVVPIVSHAPQDRDDDAEATGEPVAVLPEQIEDIKRRLAATSTKVKDFLEWAGVETLDDMNVELYKRGVELLAAKAEKQNARAGDA